MNYDPSQPDQQAHDQHHKHNSVLERGHEREHHHHNVELEQKRHQQGRNNHTQPQHQTHNNRLVKREYIIHPLQTPHDILTIKKLFRSYATSLNIDLTFQRFEDEVERLPGGYSRPGGEILIAWEVDPLPSSSCSCVKSDGGSERGGRTNELKEVDEECGTDDLNQCSECGVLVGGNNEDGTHLNGARIVGDEVLGDGLQRSERWKRDGRAVAVGCVALRPLHSASPSSASTTAITSADVDDKPVSPPTPVLNSCSISPLTTSSQLIESRPQPTKIAELKRLYVDPIHRSSGVGKILMSEIIKVARERGYDEIKLDTIPTMIAAQKMYERLGFKDVEGYCFNPIIGVRYMGLDLRIL